MRRKVLALLLGASMALTAVTGCSSSKKETEAPTEAKTEAQTEAKTEAAAAEEAGTEAAEAVEEAATEAAEAVEEAVTEAAEAVEEVETEAAEAVEEVETEAAAVEEAAAEAVEEVETEAAEIVEEVETEAAEIVEEVETEAAEIVEEVETEAAEIVEEAVTEAAETLEEVETEAAEAVEEALEAAAVAAGALEAEEAETEEAPAEEAVEFHVTVEEGTTGLVSKAKVSKDDIVVLYMNDVHGGISSDADFSGSADSLGYAGLAAVKAEVQEQAAAVTTVDCGDSIQGSVVTTESNGQDSMALMDAVGFDIRIPGNHEFDYGMEAFLDYAQNAPSEFISSNFMDLTTGETVLDPYTLIDYDVNGTEFTIGYVGISTPETIAKSTPTYFQDEDGNFIYGFDAETPQDLYDNVQESIDAAYADGADIVIGLAHLGDVGVEYDWSSPVVAANTTGMSIILDGHAHSVIPGMIVSNKDGEDVLITSTGTKLNNIGLLKLTVGADGEIKAYSQLIDKLTGSELRSDAYQEMNKMVLDIQAKYSYLFVINGSTDYALVVNDPASGDRMIRLKETNMGDFLTDAYRLVYNNDIGMLNGGSIRADIGAGPIIFMQLLTLFPWSTEYSVVEVSGQVILDCLEMGAHLYPEECGGFMQVSGLTYKIDTTIPTSVEVNSDGEFVAVNGEYRVRDVMVGDEPLDLEKIYRLGINTYYSREYGDGMTMFKDSKFIFPVEAADESAEEESTEAEAAAEDIPKEPVIDRDVVIAYLDMLGGEVPEQYADPYGAGRITLITEEDKAAEAVEETEAAVEEAVEEEAEELTEAITE